MMIKNGPLSRQTIRLNEHDYSYPGAYFITLITNKRVCIFGKIADAEIRLSDFGNIAYSEWFESMSVRDEIELYEDEFIVMPNHIHGIVWITPNDSGQVVRAHPVSRPCTPTR
jgi:REP element-mobilizing transposase RayT